jgi:hypothetical protein
MLELNKANCFNMSLLPKYTDNFIEEVYKSIGIFDADPCVKPALEVYTKAMFDSQRALLDPAQNPLTFEEVKGWFDKMCEKGKIFFEGECEHKEYGKTYYHYNIEWSNFYLSEDHYLRSLHGNGEKFIYNDLLVDHKNWYSLFDEDLLGVPVLTIFGQMKGYFEI